jgi:LL-diaminopimelate aminotransferase
MRVANRVADLPPYVFARVGTRIAELRAAGMDVINLGIGSPDLPPPRPLIETLHQSALDPNHHGYAGYYGIPGLRAAIAGYYRRRFHVELDPEHEVLPLIGSKEGTANVALAFIDPGDVALVPDPGYPTYGMGTLLAGGQVYRLGLVQEDGYLPDLAAIPEEVLCHAKLLWLNYPNNPTGATATLSFLARAVAFAREYNLLLCHDNPYCDVTYDGYVAPSVLEVPGAKDVCIEFNSLSKTYNMAGWRVGMAVGSPEAVEALARVKTNVDSGIFRPIQDAAIAALSGDQGWLAERNAIYQRRRDLIIEALPGLGLEAVVPQAALYVWARIPDGIVSTDFSWSTLERTGVWLTPGTAFGNSGQHHVRLSLTVPEDRLKEACERLSSM